VVRARWQQRARDGDGFARPARCKARRAREAPRHAAARSSLGDAAIAPPLPTLPPPARRPPRTLSTWLSLPWRPRIAIGGATRYTLTPAGNRVARHVESWTVTATEALLQLFRPTPGPPAAPVGAPAAEADAAAAGGRGAAAAGAAAAATATAAREGVGEPGGGR
jgi:hypothetical protein